MWGEAPVLRAFLLRAGRRLAVIAAAEGAAIGLAIAVAIAIGAWAGGWPIVLSIAGGLKLAASGAVLRTRVPRWPKGGWRVAYAQVYRVRSRGPRGPRQVAGLIESRAPGLGNLLVTAAELIDEPERVRPYIGERVCGYATRVASGLDLAALVPVRRALLALGVVGAFWVGTVTLAAAYPLGGRSSAAGAGENADVSGVDVLVTPPEYTGIAAQTLRDPARIEALAGSRIRLTVRASATGVSVETLTGRQALASADAKTFTGDVLADADGYVAIEPTAADGRAGVRRLIGLSVTPDRLPRVRLTAPGRDLLVPNANRSLELAVETDDDIALASLRLRYTKVSGSGEQFTFTDGEVPLEITRTNDKTWTATGTWPLGALGLEQGDMVVYRGVATDRRPGAPVAESDTYIVEITAPGAEAMAGFAIDDEKAKYALSQQMVILKTERLIASVAAGPVAAVSDSALGLAAEQRAVRAQFVFMMGGEFAEEVLAAANMADLNEEAQAAAEADLAAGRMANQGRLDLIRAIRSMSRANASLTSVDLAQALKDEKAALTYLEGAFSRARYILRALTERERLDLTRRLTGVLAAVLRDVHPRVEPVAEARVTELRRALAGIAELAGTVSFDTRSAARATTLAESVLQVDPSLETLRQVAARLSEASAAIGRTRSDDARRLLGEAATALGVALRADLLAAPSAAGSPDVRRLEGALSDALRHPGGPR
jgi:hypothetical protein